MASWRVSCFHAYLSTVISVGFPRLILKKYRITSVLIPLMASPIIPIRKLQEFVMEGSLWSASGRHSHLLSHYSLPPDLYCISTGLPHVPNTPPAFPPHSLETYFLLNLEHSFQNFYMARSLTVHRSLNLCHLLRKASSHSCKISPSPQHSRLHHMQLPLLKVKNGRISSTLISSTHCTYLSSFIHLLVCLLIGVLSVPSKDHKYLQGGNLDCSSLASSETEAPTGQELCASPIFCLALEKLSSLSCSLCSHTGIFGGQSLPSLSRATLLYPQDFIFEILQFFILVPFTECLVMGLDSTSESCVLTFRTPSEALQNGFSWSF